MAEMIVAPDGLGTGYGSHQPALRGLAEFTKIRSVIEFGAGLYSTHLFLDRGAFPDLDSLITLESEGEWAEKVRVDDDRHKLIIMAPDEFAWHSKDMKADFVFLDCAPMVIRNSLKKQAVGMAPIVGMHDVTVCDVGVKEFKYIKGFGGDVLTVFFSNDVDLSALEMIHGRFSWTRES